MLVFLLGAAGCSSAALSPRDLSSSGAAAEVTGFASIPAPAYGGSPTGAVTVRITRTAASRLAVLVDGLPSVPPSQLNCAEPPGLMYRIVFGGDTASKTVVEGYRCDAGVRVTVAGKPGSWRRDANCTLLRAVRLVLPDRARGTRGLSIGCDG